MLRTSRSAFTLIEVLVTVGIIALLASILLPSVGRARWQAKTVACRANLHDLGAGLIMYTHQFNDYYPLTSGSHDSFFGLWKARILKDPAILEDPATHNVVRPSSLAGPVAYAECDHPTGQDQIPYLSYGEGVSDIDDNARRGSDDSSGGHSYEYLAHPVGHCTFFGPDAHRRATHFRIPAMMPLVHDADDPLHGDEDCINSLDNNGNNCPQSWDNHGQYGMNMLFADGHAVWIRKWTTPAPCICVRCEYVTCENPNGSIDKIFARVRDDRSYR